MGCLQSCMFAQRAYLRSPTPDGPSFSNHVVSRTTTALTTSLASHVSTFLSLSPDNKAVELAVRAFFFGMNLAFNGAMWALFTAALTRGDSTTRVSIVNVSANFLVTAVLGWMVFGEKLPALWWVGASLLAAGNVVIGMRESAEKPGGTIGLDETRDEAVAAEEEQEELLWRMERGRHSNHGHDPEDGDLVELDETDSSGGKTQARTRTSLRTSEEEARIQKGNEVDAPI